MYNQLTPLRLGPTGEDPSAEVGRPTIFVRERDAARLGWLAEKNKGVWLQLSMLFLFYILLGSEGFLFYLYIFAE
jgi:hypothetical protein